MTASLSELTAAADRLERDSGGFFRVLRRFVPRTGYHGTLVGRQRIGAFVDVEGTGLDTATEKIIQFAGVRFTFDDQGNIGVVLGAYSALEDPGVPLEPEITDVTGLTDAMLAGQKIDDGQVAQLLHGVDLLIAHNADYDRKMTERRWPTLDFRSLPWACSQRDVDWKQFDCQYVGLEYLLMKACGEIFTPHDALDDCRVGLHILAEPRNSSGRSPFQLLLESVQQPTIRLWARHSAFETKDTLRLRRFRWDPVARCWWKDLKPDQLEAERTWLVKHVYAYGTRRDRRDDDYDDFFDGEACDEDLSDTTIIVARDRYSVRA